MTTEEKILKLFEQSNDWTPKEITFQVNVSKQMVHRVLNKLIEDNKLEKFGKPPHVIYRRAQTKNSNEIVDASISEKESAFLGREFLLISPTGDYLEGVSGFFQWCEKRDLPFQKTVQEFIKTKSRYEFIVPNINSTTNMNIMISPCIRYKYDVV